MRAKAASAKQQFTSTPLVRGLYDGNWPSDEEAQDLVEELFYQRAIHSYMRHAVGAQRHRHA